MVSLGSMMSGLMILEQTPGVSSSALATSPRLVKAMLRHWSETSCMSLAAERKRVMTWVISQLSASLPGDGTLSRTWVLRPRHVPDTA